MAESSANQNHVVTPGDEFSNFRGILDCLPNMIYVVDRNCVYRFMNPAYAAHFKIDSAIMLGKTIADLHGEASLQTIKPFIDRAFAGEAVTVEMATPTITGFEGVLRGIYNPLRSADGGIVGVIATISVLLDNSFAEQESREKLTKSEERLRMASEAGNVGIWEWDVLTGDLFWSDRVKIIYGLPLDEAPSMDEYVKRIYPGDLERTRTNIRKALEPTNDQPYESIHRVLDGKTIKWVQGNGQVVFDETGKPLRMSGTVLDITARKSAEAKAVQLKEVGGKLALAMTTDDMSAIITAFGNEVLGALATSVYIDRSGSMFKMSPVAGDALNTLPKAKGLHPYSDACLEGSSVFLDDWLDLLALYPQLNDTQSSPYSICAVALMLDRKVIGVLGLKFESPRIFNEDFRRFVLTFADQCAQTLERVKLYDQEKAARLEAEGANKAKSLFLANMSHEIRTPLGAILGFADMVKDDAISAVERDEFISIIIRNGHMLNKVINDILDLSKIESERLDVESLEFDLGTVVNDVIALLGFQAREKGLELILQLKAGVPRRILTDPTRLKQILFNLVGNALKFTSKGKIDIVISDASAADSDHRTLRFVIQDTGMGIAQEHAQGIFEPFVQADSSTTRQFGGTGLGLVIAKRLAQVLGGDLELIGSTLGSGSTFAFTIAAGPKSVSQARAIADEPGAKKSLVINQKVLAGLHILVVDDGPDNQALIGRMIKGVGAAVSSAMNGREAVEMALENSYDLILMDIQMPVMDGFGALSILRANNYPAPILALTAHAMKGDREQSLSAGFLEHLLKPVDRYLLIESIRKHCVKK